MIHRFLAALLLAFSLALPASAAKKERALPKDLPPYGEMKPVSPPAVQQTRLPNGLSLWLVPRPGFPKVAFAIAVRGGRASDPQERPGLSEVLLGALDQGTKSRSAKQIAEEIQAAGGELGGSAGADALYVITYVLAEKADSAITLLADVLQNATFPENEVAIAKRRASDSLRARESDPAFLAERGLFKAIFRDHPYSVVAPTQESIARTTADELRHEYARRFRPDQTLLVAVGDFKAESMARTIEEVFGGWRVPPEPAPAPVPVPAGPNPRAVFVINRENSIQTNLALGALGPTQADPEYAAVQVANAIYGGMFGSRLVENIREEKGYTYSPEAFLQTWRTSGLLRTVVAVRNEVTGASLNEINYELNRLATTSPDEEELVRAQRYLVGTKAIALQRQAAVAQELASLWVRGLPPEELSRQTENILKVNGKDVVKVARKYFPAPRQTMVAVGEESLIREELAPLGVELKPAP